MSAQQFDAQTAEQQQLKFTMSPTQAAYPPGNYNFNATSMPDMHFDSSLNQPMLGDNSVMWGGMQELTLDNAMSHKWQQNAVQGMYGQQGAAQSINQYGQITPPNDDTQHMASFKTEDNAENNAFMGPGQPQEQPPAASTRSKRAAGPNGAAAPKRKPKNSMEAPMEKQKKTTRKARKGYKATTKEEEDDSDGEVKRERFLERNRVAASKCRYKKKEWTNGLEAHARELAAANAHLNACALSLKEEMLYLKTECLKHTNCDCARIREYLDRSIAGMNPSNILNMSSGVGGANFREPSAVDSTYGANSATSPSDTTSMTDKSRNGSMSLESQAGAQAEPQSNSDRNMRTMLEASIAAPNGGATGQRQLG